MKTFGWTRPVRGADGEIITVKESPVRCRTVALLGPGYGPDSDKRLVFTMRAHDLIGIRPERTGRELVIEAKEVYALLVRRDAERQRRERQAARRAKRGSNFTPVWTEEFKR